MGLNVEQKKAIVADMHEILGKSQAIVAADYLGLTVAQMTELRAQARALGVQVKVLKNTFEYF